ncbi:hypothetical protein RRG08_000041 [Elysia crispata]|uniref:Uncharacterized protein n=1 Tax=Elysia crispata TaxID=231223 RepID=A0AAE0Y7I3_9GAST|nr:hypothetical protein RRG08_000041 [Elysia crispata]
MSPPYPHLTVIHNQNFVDPGDRTSTAAELSSKESQLLLRYPLKNLNCCGVVLLRISTAAGLSSKESQLPLRCPLENLNCCWVIL